jgi:hypothetical protein
MAMDSKITTRGHRSSWSVRRYHFEKGETMVSKFSKGQLLVELMISMLVLTTCVLLAAQMLTTAKGQAKKYDSVGKWRNYGRN